MRAFARDLDISPSSLNDFLKGCVGMSPKRVEQLSKKLSWQPARYEHFLDLISWRFDKDVVLRQTAAMRIKKRMKDKNSYFDGEHFRMISNWYHLVIIELCHLLDDVTPTLIAEKIKISAKQAKGALNDLTTVGILELTTKGYKPVNQVFQYGDGAPSDAIRNFHFQILQQAQHALETLDMSKRESHSLVFSIAAVDRQKMNAEIRKSLYTIINKYAAKENINSIQVVSLQSFERFNLEEI